MMHRRSLPLRILIWVFLHHLTFKFQRKTPWLVVSLQGPLCGKSNSCWSGGAEGGRFSSRQWRIQEWGQTKYQLPFSALTWLGPRVRLGYSPPPPVPVYNSAQSHVHSAWQVIVLQVCPSRTSHRNSPSLIHSSIKTATKGKPLKWPSSGVQLVIDRNCILKLIHIYPQLSTSDWVLLALISDFCWLSTLALNSSYINRVEPASKPRD